MNTKQRRRKYVQGFGGVAAFNALRENTANHYIPNEEEIEHVVRECEGDPYGANYRDQIREEFNA